MSTDRIQVKILAMNAEPAQVVTVKVTKVEAPPEVVTVAVTRVTGSHQGYLSPPSLDIAPEADAGKE